MINNTKGICNDVEKPIPRTTSDHTPSLLGNDCINFKLYLFTSCHGVDVVCLHQHSF